MKRLFYIIVVLMASFCLSHAQNPADVLRFESTVHDFGQVLISDGAVSCVFEGENVSGRDISLMSVTTSCGCTNVRYTHDTVKPGGKVKISATYSNDEGPYAFDKTLTVKISGVSRPILLHLRGVSQEKILPDREIFTNVYANAIGLKDTEYKCGNLEQGGYRSEEFTVANLSDKAVKLSFASVTDGLKLEVSPNPVPAGSRASIRYVVNAKPDKWGYNVYSAVPVVNGVNSGKSFSIKAFTAENFSSLTMEEKQGGSRPVFDESTYSFGHKKKGAKFTASFVCQNRGKADLKVYKVDSDYAGAVPSAFPQIKAGGSAKFNVEVDTSSLPKGEALVMITLTTNSPLRPVVTLFITGIID